eukprot:7291801-Prymnesium_polylepis.3
MNATKDTVGAANCGPVPAQDALNWIARETGLWSARAREAAVFLSATDLVDCPAAPGPTPRSAACRASARRLPSPYQAVAQLWSSG